METAYMSIIKLFKNQVSLEQIIILIFSKSKHQACSLCTSQSSARSTLKRPYSTFAGIKIVCCHCAPPASMCTRRNISWRRHTANFKSIRHPNPSIHQVVNDLTFNMENSIKQLDNFTEEIKEQLAVKGVDEQQLRRQIGEAKERVLGLVQRFFTDFEKEVNKSIIEFNVSMRENYREMENQISTMKTQLVSKIDTLATEKVLKTIISYHSKEEDKKIQNNITVLKETLDLCGSKRASLMIDNNSIQKMVNQLSQYMYLSFENWEQDIKYVADFIKTGFTSRSQSHSCSLVNQ